MEKIYTTILAVALSLSVSAINRVYVNDDATGNNDGSSWTDAYTDLNDALITANNYTGTEIWIAEGFYTRLSQNQSFYVDNDALLFGGFAGTETDIDERDIQNHPTIISGDVDWNDTGVPSSSNSSMGQNATNVFRVLSANRALFDGLIIEHAFSTTEAGGGIKVESSTLENLEISNCVIRENVSMNRAGVLYYAYETSSFYMFNNRIEDNVNTDNASSYTIEYRTANNNSANAFNGDVHLVNNLFKHNISESTNSMATCARFTVFNGSEIYLYLTNNTFIDNHQTAIGQTPLIGYEFVNSGCFFHTLVNNNIFYNNSGANLIFGQLGGSGTFDSQSASCNHNVQDFTDNLVMQNTHIITTSPFVDYANGDLTPITAYQNIGDLTFYDSQYLSIPLTGQVYPTTDLAGNPRFNGQGAISIGAYQGVDSPNTSGIQESKLLAISAYPNPVQNHLKVEASAPISEVKIYNALGQIVYNNEIINSDQFQINTAHLENGVYLIKIRYNNGTEHSLKVIK